MPDRVSELVALLRSRGADAVREQIRAEAASAPPADVETRDDAIRQLYGDEPDLLTED